MSSVYIQPADQVPLSTLATVINRAYSDYYFPIYVTEASLRAMLEREDITPANCAVAVEDGEAVGVGLLGVRGRSGWISGMGIVPQRRHQGIGRRVLRHLLARARTLGVRTLRLEVVEENVHAHALYQQQGFRDVRYLHLLERPSQPAPPVPQQFTPAPERPQVLLRYYPDFHNVRNCWQRARPSLERLGPQSQGWALYEDGRPAAYILGQFHTHDVRVFDLAAEIDNPHSRTYTAALLKHLHARYPHASGNAYNVAEDDPNLDVYFALGYRTAFRQIEMELKLS